MSRSIFLVCLAFSVLTSTQSFAQPDISLDYDPTDGMLYLTAPIDPARDYQLVAFSIESSQTPVVVNLDGFINGTLWTNQVFNGRLQILGTPGLSAPQDCFPLVTYDTGLTLDDFGTFEAAIVFDNAPGSSIFGDIGIKNVPEPGSLWAALIGLSLAAVYRRR